MERLEHLFLVRLWLESGSEPNDAWRGSIEHVRSGSRRYFGALAELDAFITHTTGRPIAAQREPRGT